MSTVTAKNLVEAQYATAAGATVYTSPVSNRTIIDKMTATNGDSGAHTLTVNIVPSAGAVSGANAILSAKSLAAGTEYVIDAMTTQILEAGDFIHIAADADSKIVIRISGRQVA